MCFSSFFGFLLPCPLSGVHELYGSIYLGDCVQFPVSSHLPVWRCARCKKRRRFTRGKPRRRRPLFSHRHLLLHECHPVLFILLFRLLLLLSHVRGNEEEPENPTERTPRPGLNAWVVAASCPPSRPPRPPRREVSFR